MQSYAFDKVGRVNKVKLLIESSETGQLVNSINLNSTAPHSPSSPSQKLFSSADFLPAILNDVISKHDLLNFGLQCIYIMLIVVRNFPLIEIGYSLEVSTKYFSSSFG